MVNFKHKDSYKVKVHEPYVKSRKRTLRNGCLCFRLVAHAHSIIDRRGVGRGILNTAFSFYHYVISKYEKSYTI